jgi:WD40 repeat protein
MAQQDDFVLQLEHAFGVHSVTYSLRPHEHDESRVQVPLASSVVEWDLARRAGSVLARLDSIATSLATAPNGKLVATATWDGTVALWTSAWEPLCARHGARVPLRHLYWSPDARHLLSFSVPLTTARRGEALPLGHAQVWRVGEGGHSLEPVATVEGRFIRGEWRSAEHFVVLENQPTKLRVFDLEGREVAGLDVGGAEWALGAAISEGRRWFAAARRDRTALVFDLRDLRERARGKVEGAGPVWTMLWLEDGALPQLLIPSGRGELLAHALDADSLRVVASAGAAAAWPAPREPQHICWAGRGRNKLWCASSEGLQLVSRPQEVVERPPLPAPQTFEGGASPRGGGGGGVSTEASKLQFHRLACCGASFSPDGDRAVVGDLGGQLLVWETARQRAAPRLSAQLHKAVRSVAWKPSGDAVWAGCMDGSIWEWSVPRAADGTPREMKDAGTVPQRVLMADDAVTCIRWHAAPQGGDLHALAGTAGGRIMVLHQRAGESDARVQLAFMGHAPVDSKDPEYRERFGALHIKADVWSAAWSPDGALFASGSEDQSTRVWVAATGAAVRELRGHTTAVTCLDWQRMRLADGKLVEVLATSGDDCKVMLWNAASWELLATLTSDGVHGWHTYTYLALEAGGRRLACGTENGYVIVWDVPSGATLFARRVHHGSIEGLDWHKGTDRLVTASADCTTQVFRIRAARVAPPLPAPAEIAVEEVVATA